MGKMKLKVEKDWEFSKPVVLLTTDGCEKCKYVKDHIKDFPKLDKKVQIIDATTSDGMAILAYHQMLEGAPMPFLEIKDQWYEKGYKKAYSKVKNEAIYTAKAGALVKRIKEECK